MSKISRQRQWQIKNPLKAKLLREQTKTRQRYALLEQGYVKTHDELYDIITDYEKRNNLELPGEDWWLVFEYLDFKYNGCKYTDLTMDRRLAQPSNDYKEKNR